MGTLVAMRYPTQSFAYLADHTYVQCDTEGAAWGCWGGKTGGRELRRGQGSTRRADRIAEEDERGGIKCYLINGVCHQAANRILFPAGITVRGARGYDLSELLFGMYGRPRGILGLCKSPFKQHPNVTGDLQECVHTVAVATRSGPSRRPSVSELRGDRKYIRGVNAIYDKAKQLFRAKTVPGPDLQAFELALFNYKVRRNLGSRINKSTSRKLQDIRRSTGLSIMKIEDWFINKEITAKQFAKAFDTQTILFQDALADVLKGRHYRKLLGLRESQRVKLSDPRIMRKAYGD